MMFPIKYNGDVLHHNARVGVDGGIVESLDFVNDLSEQTKRVNMPLLLDIYPNAAAAYSLRKLRTAYTGAAIRVRRSSDNTETDIGFNNAGDLDTSALAAFVGNGNGFVSTWYDQSNNNRHATQTTQANQPIVVSGGTLFLEKNKPVVYANNRTKRMNIPSFTLVGDYSIIIASTLKSFGRNMWMGTLGLSGYVIALDVQNQGFSIRHDGEVGGANFSGVKTLNPELHFFQRFGTNMSHSRNGVNNITTELSPQGTNFTINLLFDGYVLGGQNYMMDANAFEFIIYNSNQSPNRIGIETNINSYYKIYQQEALLLDYYPDAAAAYSLRKLRSGYTGAAIQVRRSSDNAVQNIGFDSNGGLDTTALTTFVGAGNTGFVSTWYDQSLNGNNVTQTTQANQPVIFSGGTVTTENGKPSILYDGSNDFLKSSSALSLDNKWTIINVLNGNPSTNSYQTIFSRTTSSTSIGTLHIAQYISNNNLQNIFYPNGDSRQFTTPTTYNVFGAQKILINEWDSGNYNIIVNNDLQNYMFNSSSGFTVALNFALGAELNGTLPFRGTMQEVIIYKLYQASNRKNIAFNINSYYNIYPTDSDANAFVTAAGLTGTTQIQAVNKLVTDLKGYGLWGKMKAIYPFVGGTASSHKFNLKDPRDVDGAFRLVFNGTWTHTTGGATSGFGSNATTYFVPETNAIRGNRSFGVYTRSTNPSALISSPSSTNSSVGDFIRPNDPTFRFGQGYNATTITSPITAAGFYYMSRVPGGTYKQTIYLNGNLIGTGSADEQTAYLLTNSTVIEGSLIAFSYISEGLTDNQMVNLYTAVQTFQTTLGRQV